MGLTTTLGLTTGAEKEEAEKMVDNFSKLIIPQSVTINLLDPIKSRM